MYDIEDGNPPPSDIYLDTGPSERGAHRIMTAAKCLRQYAYDVADKHGPQMPKSPALMTGSMIHLMLAHRYALKAFKDGADTLAAADRVITKAESGNILTPEQALQEFVFRDSTGAAEQFYPLVLKMYQDYDTKYGTERNWIVIGVELQYRVHLPRLPSKISLYTQRADLVVRDRLTNKVYFVDHKKAYEISTKTAAQYILHGQFLGYAKLGQKFYGKDFGGNILNRISPGPPTKFARTPIDAAPKAVADYVANVVAIERLVDWTAQEYGSPLVSPDKWPASFSEEVCYGKYGKCKYFDRCRFGGGTIVR